MSQILAGFGGNRDAVAIIALVVVLTVCKAVYGLKGGNNSYRKLPYKKRKYFFTMSEKKFYDVLSEVIDELDMVLFGKVRMADILYVDSKKSDKKNRNIHFNKISNKHVDFVILDKKNLSPVLLIELDDPSHNRKDRMARDFFVDDAYKSAGIKILHIKTSLFYNKNKIKSLISNEIPGRSA